MHEATNTGAAAETLFTNRQLFWSTRPNWLGWVWWKLCQGRHRWRICTTDEFKVGVVDGDYLLEDDW